MILEAETFALERWPDETRLYTYVNAKKIQSSNPGYCFIKAVGQSAESRSGIGW
jgi:hypothetical protein